MPATAALPPIRPFLALGLGALALALLGGAFGIGKQGWRRAADVLRRAGHYLGVFIAFTTARKPAPTADKPERRARVRREPVIESKAPRERQEPELRVAAPKTAPAPRPVPEGPIAWRTWRGPISPKCRYGESRDVPATSGRSRPAL